MCDRRGAVPVIEGQGHWWHKMAAPTASIELNLEHQDLVFYSGDRIRGALVVHLSTAVTIAGKYTPCSSVVRHDTCERRTIILISHFTLLGSGNPLPLL